VPVPQVNVTGDTSGSTAAGAPLLRRQLHTKRQRERLIAEVRIKLTSLAQAARVQIEAEQAQAARIDVEKPEMDIDGVSFLNKGPRDHK
jgi:hypothetical protein